MRKFTLLFVAFLVSLSVWAQERTVTGTVTAGEDGSVIPGANVVLKGTSTGVATDANGSYTINVPGSDAVLVYTFIGRQAQEQVVGDRAVINVALASATKEVDEVVVTALGIQREARSLGYAATKVGGTEVKNSRETNMVAGLSAKVAGVQVINSSGSPGSSAKIVMRGNRSFTGDNQPLFVIDGIPMDNNTNTTNPGDNPFNPNLEQVQYSNRAIDINPEDIETMTVLKGPAAAALYGVRAANGAIIITTKKGQKGSPIRASLSSNVDFYSVNKLPEKQDIYAQGTGGGVTGGTPKYNTAGVGDDGIPGTDDDPGGTSSSWGPKISDLSGQGVSAHDNYKSFFRKNAPTFTNDFSITGGSDNTSFRLNLGQLKQQGVIPNTDFTRTTVRLTTESQVTKRLTIFATANYIKSGGKRPQQGSNTSGVALSLFRAPASYDLAAGYEYPNGFQRNYLNGYDNPFWTVNKNQFQDFNDRILGNVMAAYQILDWLKASYRLGTDVYSDRREGNYAAGSNNLAGNGEVTRNTQNHSELYGDLLLSANKDINENLNLNVILGNNINVRADHNVFARGRNLAIPNFYNLSNTSERYADNSDTRRHSAAFFYDVTVGLYHSLYLNTTGRLEYSSTFGPNRRSFFFPSGNLSYVFSDLPVFQGSKILSFGKVRVAVARSANTPPPYASNTTYTQPFFTDGFTPGFSFPFSGLVGYGPTNLLGNPNLKPEFTTGYEAGLDLRFFDQRVNIDLTLYNQVTTDVIVQRPIPYSTGYAAFYDNAGEITNKGIELQLGLIPVRTQSGFEWNIQTTYTKNVNKVTKVLPGVDQIELETGFGNPAAFAIVGQPYGVLFGTYWDRDAQGRLLLDDEGKPTQNATGRNLGNSFPKYTIGIRNTFSFKGFSLTALLDIRQGGSLWNGTVARMNRLGVSKASGDREHDYIIPGVHADGTPNTTPVSAFYYWSSYQSDAGAAEQAIVDGSWVRLREIGLSYSFKNVNLFNFFKGIDVNLIGRNLFLWTKYKGVDPETSLTGAGSNITGFDYFNNPNTKSYGAGVRLSF